MSSGSRLALLVAFAIGCLTLGGLTLLGFAYLAVSDQEVQERSATHVETEPGSAGDEDRDPVDGQEARDSETGGSP